VVAVKVGQGSTPSRIRLSWPTTKRLDNHAPEFRPTHSDRMYGRERILARQAEDAFAAIDRRTLEAYLAGEIRWEEFLLDYMAAFTWFQEALTYTLHEQFAESAKDEEVRIRKAINKDLARLGSPVRVVEPEKVAKQVHADMSWGISPDEFNRVNGASVRWAQNESAGLITNMAAEQKTAVQEAITRAHTAAQTWSTGRTTLGMTRRQTSQALMSILMEVDPTTPAAARLAKIYGVHAPGLTPGWERATMNFADRQADDIYRRIGTGLSPGKAQDMVAARTTRYAHKLRRARSRMIARTEIMRASNQGQLYAMTKAVNDGLVSPASAGKMWMTGPIDVCPVCEGLQGQVIPLNESFALVGDAPPAHPNCRCIISLIPNISKAPVPRGIGNQSFPPGHAQNPMVWDFSGGASTAPRMVLPPAPSTAAPPVPPPGPPSVPTSLPASATEARAAVHIDDLAGFADDYLTHVDEPGRWGKYGQGRGVRSMSDGKGQIVDVDIDVALERARKSQGFDGRATIADTHKELDELVDRGGIDLMRGELSEETLDQLLYGDDFFPGQGIYGNGTYFASATNQAGSAATVAEGASSAVNIATNYAGTGRGKTILRAVLNPDARVITENELRGVASRFTEAMFRVKDAISDAIDTGMTRANLDSLLDDVIRTAVRGPTPGETSGLIPTGNDPWGLRTLAARWADSGDLDEITEMARFLGLAGSDPGHMATILGYDAITEIGDDIIVVLNRKALTISKRTFDRSEASDLLGAIDPASDRTLGQFVQDLFPDTPAAP
jgi:hypothetical protein